MTKLVTMLQTRRGEDGTLWAAGSSYVATDAFAQMLITHNLASGVSTPSDPNLLDRLAANPLNGGPAPQRVILLGDSLTMRSARAIAAATATVQATPTDVEIALGSGAALPPPGSYVRIINQADAALNIDVPVVGSGTNSTIVRFPFSVSGRISATVSGAIYGITNDTGWWGYAEAELAALGYPVQVVRNAGDGGDTLVQIRARIASEVRPYVQAGDIVVYMGGVNGAGTGSDDSLDESTAANMLAQTAAIIDELLALGVTVHAGTVTQAQSSAYWATSAATAIANTKAVNGYLRGRALAEARLKVFDAYAALGGGDYAASDVRTDNIHFIVSGAAKVGARYVDDCIADYRRASFRRVLSTLDGYTDGSSWNLLANPEFTGATGTTAPTGWTASLGSGTNALTLAARADNIGNDLTINKQDTGIGSATLSQDITARVRAGDRLVFGSEFQTGANNAEGHYFAISLEIDIGGVTYQWRMLNNQDSYANGGRLPPTGVRRFYEMYDAANDGGRAGIVVPADFTAVRFVYRLQLGASGQAEAVVSRPHVYKL